MNDPADYRRVDLLLLLDNETEDLGTEGVIPEVFFDSLLDLNHDGCENILSNPSDIVVGKVAYRDTIYFSVTNPCSCKCLDPLGDFTIFG